MNPINRPRASAFKLAFLALLLLALSQGIKPFYYDSGAYWMLGRTFTTGDGFSVLNFADQTRGYLLPLVLRSVAEMGDLLELPQSIMAKVWNAGIVALIATVLAPRYATLVWPEVGFGHARRLLLAGVIYVFWSGYLSFPLSDFPALALAFVALLAVSARQTVPVSFLAGAAACAAVMVRPAYLLLVPTVVVLAGFAWWADPAREQERRLPTKSQLAPFIALLVGIVLIALPQSLAMNRHYGVSSPIPGAAWDLVRFQLSTGLELQRYETYVGDPAEFAADGMRYIDNATVELRSTLPNQAVDNYPDYLKLTAENPVVMSGVFARRIINGMDQRYATPYVEEIDTSQRRWFRWANFTLIFLALLRIAWSTARHSLGPWRIRYFVALLLPCATIPASAVETRFLLPVYVLAYLLVLAPGWGNVIRAPRSLRGRLLVPTVIVVAYVGFMSGIWRVVHHTTNSLVQQPSTQSFPATKE